MNTAQIVGQVMAVLSTGTAPHTASCVVSVQEEMAKFMTIHEGLQ